MKKIIFAITVLAFTQTAIAQQKTAVKTSTKTISTSKSTDYEKTMAEKISALDQATTLDALSTLANDFAKIGEKEKKQWLPFYYSALANIRKGRMLLQDNKNEGVDAIADEADKNIALAEALSPMNSELFILKKMTHSLRMRVNPMMRFRTEGDEAAKALSVAKSLDANNPRIMLLEAEDTYFTPKQYGGSKEKGLEMLKKSLDMFKKFTPKTALDPNWGQKEAENLIARAQ